MSSWEVHIVPFTWARTVAASASESVGPAGKFHDSPAGTALHLAEMQRGSALEQLALYLGPEVAGADGGVV